MKQVEVLNKYYTNLDYDKKDEKKLQIELSYILNIIDLKLTNSEVNKDMSKRLQVLAEEIHKNMSFFQSLFKHVDIIYTILHDLTFFAVAIDEIQNGAEIGMETVECNLNDIHCLLVYILVTICTGSIMRSFFINYLINTNSSQDINLYNEIDSKLKHEKPFTKNEMIILEDSDLYAVIKCLMITDQFPLYKIWVQKQVNEKFLWLMKNYYFELSISIDTFQSVKDIQFYPHEHEHNIHMNTVSIWSEDIVAAKNLALSINSHIVFINTYMEFRGGRIYLSYKNIFLQNRIEETLNVIHQNESTDQKFSKNVVQLSTVKIEDTNISVGNLFYDGMWQKPVKGMYWKHPLCISNLWANATHDDIKKCYESAKKGLETWGIKSVKTRIQILSRFIPMLKLTGKFVLAAIVERWIKFPYLYGTIQGYILNEMEILYIHKPIGVIILREKNENILFFRLIQTLIAGNSVIVIFDANFCNLSSYYNMFSTCEIPPGVINLLSHENTSMLEQKLCLQKYTDYANRFFLKGTSSQTYIIPYKKLTRPKQIIIPLQ